MATQHGWSRRSFVALAAAAPAALAAAKGKQVPVGLELFSVRNELKQDPMGTVKAVAKLGYQGVEFFSPYTEWTLDQAKEMRKLMDDVGIRCWSTHNGARTFTAESLPHAIELNRALGSQYIVMASAGGKVEGVEGWKRVAETLNRGADQMKGAGMKAGFHNHQVEWMPVEGQRPMDVLAANTGKDVMLQLDVGTCVHAGADPVAWIEKNPGRIRSLHLKDWSGEGDKGYKVLFGEGASPWKRIFDAAEKKGGVEFYLIEQEGSAHPPMETVERCLASYRRMRA